jgi:HrpA-like RNA helicase
VRIIFDELSSLPVSTLLDGISEHVRSGGIAIVNSETGSGKSLLVPTKLMEDNPGDQVFVVEPRRFLAMNAPENLAAIADLKVGEKIGYLVGMAGSDEKNLYNEDITDLVYTSYGRILSSKDIMGAENIILDEIHEQSLDMTICKALIKNRYKNGNPPNSLILMSASLDAEAETSYWQDVAPVKVFSAGSGRKFTCTKRHQPASRPSLAALSLVSEGYKGILVFAPGVGEIDEIISELKAEINKPDGPKNIIIERIHGQVEYAQRQAALAPPPEGWTKILVGTNVIETGMSLPWVNAGVTTGDKKENYVREGSGAIILAKVPLVKTNVDQQAGRTNRFQDSVFIICGPISYESMASSSTPEIDRLPLTALYMHCESIDIDPDDLEFMPQPKHEKMREAAKKLKSLGFFDENLKFTKDGFFAENLPVGLETAAMLCHANKLKIIPDVIVLAALYEIGGLRKDHTIPHGFNDSSDYFDGAFAYAKAYEIQNNPDYSKLQRTELMEASNIGMRKYQDMHQIVKSLEQKFKVRANLTAYTRNTERAKRSSQWPSPGRPVVVDPEGKLFALRQCLLAASVCNMGVYKPSMGQINLMGSMMPYAMTKSTAVSSVSASQNIEIVSARLRVITPKNGKQPFTICENITHFSMFDIEEFDKIRPGIFTKAFDPDGDRVYVNGTEFYFKRVHKPTLSKTAMKKKQRNEQSLGSFMNEALKGLAAQYEQPEEEEEKVEPTALGNALQALLNKRTADKPKI